MRTRIKLLLIGFGIMFTITILIKHNWTAIKVWRERKIIDNSLRNRLPSKEAQEIEITAITAIYTLRGYHLYSNKPVCISISGELSKKQLDFLKQIHTQTYPYGECPNDTSDTWPGTVKISAMGRKDIKSDTAIVYWNYYCGSTCGCSGEFQLLKFNGKWMITKYKPGAVS